MIMTIAAYDRFPYSQSYKQNYKETQTIKINTLWAIVSARYDTIRYDSACVFNVQ